MSQVTNLAFFRARRGQRSFVCLLRQVSSVLSRNCRNVDSWVRPEEMTHPLGGKQ
jgi:hypothetical protein